MDVKSTFETACVVGNARLNCIYIPENTDTKTEYLNPGRSIEVRASLGKDVPPYRLMPISLSTL